VETDKFYLVKADTIRPLKYAKTRLPDRRLVDLEAKDVVKTHLESSVGGVDMLHQNREDDKAAYWAGVDKPDVKVNIYGNWLDKAFKLRGLNYVAEADKPAELTSVFRLTFQGAGDKKENLEILSANDEHGEVQYYAQSEFTRGLLSLHKNLAQEAIDDVKAVIEAKPGEEPPEEPKEPPKKPEMTPGAGPRPPGMPPERRPPPPLPPKK